MPSRATTPAKPMTRPRERLRSGTSDLISHSASTAVNSGSVAVRIPATEELTCCSPQAVKKVGAAMSSRVTTATGTITWRSPRNARAPGGQRHQERSAERGPAEHDHRGRYVLDSHPDEQERTAPDDRRG